MQHPYSQNHVALAPAQSPNANVQVKSGALSPKENFKKKGSGRAMTILLSLDEAAEVKAERQKSDAETASTEVTEAESSEADWVTSLWLDVKPATDKTDAKFLGLRWLVWLCSVFGDTHCCVGNCNL